MVGGGGGYQNKQCGKLREFLRKINMKISFEINYNTFGKY